MMLSWRVDSKSVPCKWFGLMPKWPNNFTKHTVSCLNAADWLTSWHQVLLSLWKWDTIMLLKDWEICVVLMILKSPESSNPIHSEPSLEVTESKMQFIALTYQKMELWRSGLFSERFWVDCLYFLYVLIR